MGKLFEVLAVEKDQEAIARRVVEEAEHVFSKRADIFMGEVKNEVPRDESQPVVPPEVKNMDSTVHAKLDYVSGHLAKYMDTLYQKESGNQLAKATVQIGETVIVEDAPVTFLLAMENKLKSIRAALATVPTLQAGVTWERDPDAGRGVYKTTHPERRVRTEKRKTPIVLYEATKEHPAQVQMESYDVPISDISIERQCGMLTSNDKAEMLDRVDTLYQAFRKARQKANAIDAPDRVRVGNAIMDYILGGV